jgi:cation diffusion facilitator CzcD-associated flavoprotein CzcO
MYQERAVIVGAGPAGVSAAVSLRDRGVQPILVDRAERVANWWRSRGETDKLNTPNRLSHMPGRPYPRRTPRFPSCGQVADYFDRYAHQDGIRLMLGTTVERIDSQPGGWTVVTSGGDIDTDNVVVATGHANTPYIPAWPQLNSFTGELRHSSEFRDASDHAGKRVLVVGSGPGGLEAAHALAPVAAKVWLAIRNPPNIVIRNGFHGMSPELIAAPLYHAPVAVADAIARFVRLRTVGDLAAHGLPIPDEGPFAACAARNDPPTVVDAGVIESIRNGSIEVVKTIGGFDGGAVSLVDGTRLQPDVVICATGFRSGLQAVVGHLGLLDHRGYPMRLAPEPAAHGLWFIGYQLRPSLIRHAGKQSRQLARHIVAQSPPYTGIRREVVKHR